MAKPKRDWDREHRRRLTKSGREPTGDWQPPKVWETRAELLRRSPDGTLLRQPRKKLK